MISSFFQDRLCEFIELLADIFACGSYAITADDFCYVIIFALFYEVLYYSFILPVIYGVIVLLWRSHPPKIKHTGEKYLNTTS